MSREKGLEEMSISCLRYHVHRLLMDVNLCGGDDAFDQVDAARRVLNARLAKQDKEEIEEEE